MCKILAFTTVHFLLCKLPFSSIGICVFFSCPHLLLHFFTAFNLLPCSIAIHHRRLGDFLLILLESGVLYVGSYGTDTTRVESFLSSRSLITLLVFLLKCTCSSCSTCSTSIRLLPCRQEEWWILCFTRQEHVSLTHTFLLLFACHINTYNTMLTCLQGPRNFPSQDGTDVRCKSTMDGEMKTTTWTWRGPEQSCRI